jgi:hypothetical protein
MIDKTLDEKQKADVESKIKKVKDALEQKKADFESKTADLNKATQARDTAKNTNERCIAKFGDL